jgi:SAM-dependent methyltransferase
VNPQKNSKKRNFWSKLYDLRARWEDSRVGGSSMEEIYPSKFRALGAEATQSSDYRCLDKLLRHVNITSSDVLTDIGCGEGRVLTYLYLRKFPGRLVGVELDPQVAQRAKERTEHCPNIEIRCANVLEDERLVEETTIYYLFNPFNGKIFSKFVARLERECTRPIQLVYLFDYYGAYLDDRPGWHPVWSGDIPRRGGETAHGSVYTFTPKEKE